MFELRQVLDTLDAHVYWKDMQGRMLGMNQANMQSMGFNDINDVLHKTDLELLGDKKDAQKYAKEIMDNDAKILKTKKKNTFTEILINNKTGKSRPLISKKSCLKDESGEIVGVVGVSLAL